jgi:Holliday junction DNA helicase RuvA
MISRLTGILLEKNPSAILLDVNGVGYEVFVPMSSLYRFPAIGEQLVLHIHFVVREDAQQLFGFAEQQERELFRILIKVNGVGPRLALAIMSGMSLHELLRHVRSGDVKALSGIPGVGKKTAERLLVELRDKLASWKEDDQLVAAHVDSVATAGSANPLSEAESALIALGYKPAEATRLVSIASAQQATADGDALDSTKLDSETLIRLALKSAVSG